LESLDLPASLESIDAKAFDGCDALTTIRVAPGNAQIRVVDGLLLTRGGKTLAFCPRTKAGGCVVPESVEEIGPQAFQGCNALTQIVLPPSVTAIAPRAFEDCRSMTQIVFSPNIKEIGWCAFEGCSALTQIELPDALETLGIHAFKDCAALTEIVLSQGVKDVGGAIVNCSSLKSFRVAPENREFRAVDGVLLSRNGKTLYRCPCGKIGTYVVPESVAKIAENAFYQCSKLTEVVLPQGVKKIANSAFYGCSALTQIELPKTLETVGG
jgi:hypothetical protein